MKTNATPLCVNFNGPPGTGKTTFGSFISDKGIFDRIFVCNLVQIGATATNNTMSFNEILNSINTSIINSAPKDKKYDGDKECVLIIFDELDKWLKSYIDRKINLMREEARKTVHHQPTANDKNTLTETFLKLSTDEEDEKRIHIKNEFLDQLYRLVDGHILSDTRKYVLVFNTNEFNTMFEKADTRHAALKTRFTCFEFSLCGKKEITDYIKKISQTVQESNTNKKNQKSVKNLLTIDDSCFDLIPDEIKISYREMTQILNLCHYNIPKFIEKLQEKISVVSKDEK